MNKYIKFGWNCSCHMLMPQLLLATIIIIIQILLMYRKCMMSSYYFNFSFWSKFYKIYFWIPLYTDIYYMLVFLTPTICSFFLLVNLGYSLHSICLLLSQTSLYFRNFTSIFHCYFYFTTFSTFLMALIHVHVTS